MPQLSIVIPTHNRLGSLDRTLDRINGLRPPPGGMEVVVVADGCTDGTEAFLQTVPMAFPMEVVAQPPSGAAAARNAGARRAKGEYLIFLDDDIEAVPALAVAHVAYLEGTEKGVGLGYLPPVLERQRGYFRQALQSWWEGMFEGMRAPGYKYSYRNLLSGNFSVRKSFFWETGGFNERFRCQEDYELGYRLLRAGGQFRFIPEAEGRHHEESDLQRSLRRKKDEGIAAVNFCATYPDLIPMYPHLQTLVRRPNRYRFAPIWQAAAGGIMKMLPLYERLGMKSRWTKAVNLLMHFWFMEGVREASGSPARLAKILQSPPHE